MNAGCRAAVLVGAAGILLVSGCSGISIGDPPAGGGAGGEAGDPSGDVPAAEGGRSVAVGGDAGVDDGGEGGRESEGPARGGQSSTEQPVAGQPSAGQPSAGQPSTNTAGETGTGSEHHSECASAAPSPLPALPEIRQQANGRPLFDLWRDLSCAEAEAAPLCSEGCETTGMCFRGRPSASEGVCTEVDIDTRCDGEGDVTGYHDGQCWMCMSAEAHARACCEGIDGFDCRAWPFPADGKPGMVCARHEDCEAGLVCGRGGTYSGGYGICQCPGVSNEQPEFCEFNWD